MRPFPVVEAQIPTDRCPGLTDRAVSAQIDLLVFHRAPQALDNDIVAPRAPTVHADGNFLAQQHADEGQAGELAALIGVENLRFAEARQRFFQSLDAEIGLHADRHSLGQYLAAEPVNDGYEIDEALRHRNVTDVGCPDLVGPYDPSLRSK